MPPFRNLFPRRPPAVNVEEASDEPGPLSAERSPARSSRPSLTLGRSRVDEPNEYKMSGKASVIYTPLNSGSSGSCTLHKYWLTDYLYRTTHVVVSDNGVYLPPSPTETNSYWQRPSSRKASRNLLDENEPFSISRESFDSYRRSFMANRYHRLQDISARSPVSQHSDTAASRTSLDSRLSRNCPRSTVNGSVPEPPTVNDIDEVEDPFEDVPLADGSKLKKRGLFSRLGDSSAGSQVQGKSLSSHHTFHFPGRRRGQSGQGAELTSMDQAK
ncbi:conserved hypothetical protein [Microsporum canis CBS 113480]|uniref:Uncharacterized protein n=1 Tax=Arthroderma otae (strain ATCC MYA-4605 / CBS 113480) TaxID=554155 RepID=C5FJX0_ARTOC|nr:conserved hypothetical protein [Microsporum canis CBS 113480]EEQ30981.1 conserved hypothetical protein [Microsporum canis CBS 113480]